MPDIKVSVIVPVYNVEKYLPQCLDSLVSQTLKEIEILVVNDGSPDNSQAIINDYAARYPDKIRSFVKPNGGLSDARNFGVQHAQGEYIGFVDSDDYVHEIMFELLYHQASEEDADAVVCNFREFGSTATKDVTVIEHPEYFNHSVEEKPDILLESKSYACNKLYRRTWCLENNFSFPVGQWFEDSAVVYNMLYMANKVTAVPEYLYYYRVDRNDSITNTINPKLYDIFKSCDSIRTFYYAHTQNRAVLDVADRLCQIHLLARLNALVAKGSIKQKLTFYSAMLQYFKHTTPNWAHNPYYKATPKNNLYVKIRHIPALMYPFLLVPARAVATVKKLLKCGSAAVAGKQEFYISPERLRDLQLIELELLKEVDRIAKENNLIYYLGEGTLLGAIRHQGFIPWDDDLDILMPREDYERFRQIAPGALQTQYAFLCEQTESCYYLPFSKIVCRDNQHFINKQVKFDDRYNGPFIDIFPLDAYDTIDARRVQFKYRIIRTLRDMLLFKARCFAPQTIKKAIVNIAAKCFSYKLLHVLLRREMTCCKQDAPYLCNFASSYHPSKQIVPREVYGKPVYVPFEDGMFPVPHDAHALLTTIYGDYMKLPPITKRSSKHGFFDEISSEQMQ